MRIGVATAALIVAVAGACSNEIPGAAVAAPAPGGTPLGAPFPRKPGTAPAPCSPGDRVLSLEPGLTIVDASRDGSVLVVGRPGGAGPGLLVDRGAGLGTLLPIRGAVLAWGPGARQVLVGERDLGGQAARLVLVDVESGAEQQLLSGTSVPYRAFSPRRSDDVVALLGLELHVFRFSDHRLVPLARDLFEPQATDEGDLYYRDADARTLHFVDLATLEQRVVATGVIRIEWAGPGGALIFGDGDARRRATDRGGPPIELGRLSYPQIEASSDGRRVFVADRQGNRRALLWDRGTRGVRELGSGVVDGRISADGAVLAWTLADGGGSRLLRPGEQRDEPLPVPGARIADLGIRGRYVAMTWAVEGSGQRVGVWDHVKARLTAPKDGAALMDSPVQAYLVRDRFLIVVLEDELLVVGLPSGETRFRTRRSIEPGEGHFEQWDEAGTTMLLPDWQDLVAGSPPALATYLADRDEEVSLGDATAPGQFVGRHYVFRRNMPPSGANGNGELAVLDLDSAALVSFGPAPNEHVAAGDSALLAWDGRLGVLRWLDLDTAAERTISAEATSHLLLDEHLVYSTARGVCLAPRPD